MDFISFLILSVLFSLSNQDFLNRSSLCPSSFCLSFIHSSFLMIVIPLSTIRSSSFPFCFLFFCSVLEVLLERLRCADSPSFFFLWVLFPAAAGKLPALSPAQLMKLRHLSIVSLAARKKVLFSFNLFGFSDFSFSPLSTSPYGCCCCWCRSFPMRSSHPTWRLTT